MRPFDASFPTQSLRALLESERAIAWLKVTRGRATVYGVVLAWPGIVEPQTLPIRRVLWDCLALPVANAAELAKPSVP